MRGAVISNLMIMFGLCLLFIIFFIKGIKNGRKQKKNATAISVQNHRSVSFRSATKNSCKVQLCYLCNGLSSTESILIYMGRIRPFPLFGFGALLGLSEVSHDSLVSPTCQQSVFSCEGYTKFSVTWSTSSSLRRFEGEGITRSFSHFEEVVTETPTFPASSRWLIFAFIRQYLRASPNVMNWK